MKQEVQEKKHCAKRIRQIYNFRNFDSTYYSDSVVSAISGDTLPKIKKTPRTSITISNYSPSKHVYIYIPSLIYLDKVESRDEGLLFPRKASSRGRMPDCVRASRPPPSMPLANYSPLLEILNFR